MINERLNRAGLRGELLTAEVAENTLRTLRK